ncbi:MAG: hypothetical protein GX459_08665 [Bacteroidales bacterium]|nr:hypothetical protein [Bacteroidales bacterium]
MKEKAFVVGVVQAANQRIPGAVAAGALQCRSHRTLRARKLSNATPRRKSLPHRPLSQPANSQ